MAEELYLDYEALGAATTRFSDHSDELEGILVFGCETGIVDISSAISTISDNRTDLATNLATLATITTEVRNEVITVDNDQALRYPVPSFGAVPSGYVNPEIPGQLSTGITPPVLDLPPELTPMGPYAPGTEPF